MYIHHIFLIVVLSFIFITKKFQLTFSIFLINEFSTIFLNLNYITKQKKLTNLNILSKSFFIITFFYIRIYYNYKFINYLYHCVTNSIFSLDNYILLNALYLYYFLNLYWFLLILKKVIYLFKIPQILNQVLHFLQ